MAAEKRFVADAMLGKLAKWLRVMGYDTYYRPRYKNGALQALVEEGRLLLTGDRKKSGAYPNAVLVTSDRTGDQLRQLVEGGILSQRGKHWFTRCLICNTVLQDAPPEEAREHVPEYVFYHNPAQIRRCPSCGRYFWPGSHRDRMVDQLAAWGFETKQ